MSGNLFFKNNAQLFSFFRMIDNLHTLKSPSRPPGFCLRARAGLGLSLYTNIWFSFFPVCPKIPDIKFLISLHIDIFRNRYKK